MFVQLLLWAIGVQLDEAMASVGLVGCAVAVAVHSIGNRRFSGSSLLRWKPLLAFVGWALLAPLFLGRVPTGAGVARVVDWLGVPIAAYAFGTVTSTQRIRIAAIAGSVFLVSCALAGLQHFGFWPSRELFAQLSGTRIGFHRVYERVPGVENRFMGGGLLFHRLKFAHLGGLAVLVSLVWAFHAPRAPLRLYAAIVCAIGFLSVVFFPYARAAAVALFLSALLTAAWLARRRRAVAILAVVILAISPLVLIYNAPLRTRFISASSDSGSGNRLAIVKAGLAAIRAHPVVGVGLGQFRPSKFAMPDAPPDVLEHPGKAHNQFISMAAEMGAPGLGLFLWLLIWLALKMGIGQAQGLAGTSALLFFCLLSLFHDPLYHAEFSMGLVLVLGAAMARVDELQPMMVSRIPISRR
jgi:O-antigen ligase